MFGITQGNVVNATRYLQRAAMAAEAAIVQAEDEKQMLLNGLTLRETMVAAFSGHVQTKLGRARDQKSWKQAELQLETVSASHALCSVLRHKTAAITDDQLSYSNSLVAEHISLAKLAAGIVHFCAGFGAR